VYFIVRDDTYRDRLIIIFVSLFTSIFEHVGSLLFEDSRFCKLILLLPETALYNIIYYGCLILNLTPTRDAWYLENKINKKTLVAW